MLAVLAVAIGLFSRPESSRRADLSTPKTVATRTVPDKPTPVLPYPDADNVEIPAPAKSLSNDPGARIPAGQAWLKNAVAAAASDGRPMIAVVIDDVGIDRPRSQRAMALPAPVTIALLAYADDARDQAAMARRGGHELIVHLPMEPENGGTNPGPNALLTDLPIAEFNRRIEWNLSQFAGYVGVNNHMGSKLTSDPAALAPVMSILKQRGLMFLDSRTTDETKGLAVAKRFGVPAVERNVFIDHELSPITVRTALVRVEDLAQRNGYAIAIGHPKDVTLDALEEWLPGVKDRGFAVVPLTAIVRHLVTGQTDVNDALPSVDPVIHQR
ncbi:MAG: divergent polysaccharide deacetylase family protein [Alphaproteobacteria bacterium]|nr:divergent polysaccharide deacetylase family protein [Alphaproteobacteria bacterium]